MRLLKRIISIVILSIVLTVTVGNDIYKNQNINNVHAVAVGTTVVAYSVYEICLYVGCLLITSIGVGYAYENRDDIAELGKQFIDSIELPAVNEWWLGSSDSATRSYVYGSEVFEEVQEMPWEVIQGGGNSPKNDDDNDGDGDKDSDDRTKEL